MNPMEPVEGLIILQSGKDIQNILSGKQSFCHMHVDDAGFLRNPVPMGDGGNGSDFFLRTFHKGQRQDAHKGAIAIGTLPYAGFAAGPCLVGGMTDIKNFSIGGKGIFPEPGKKMLSDVLDIDFPVISLRLFKVAKVMEVSSDQVAAG